MKEILLYNIVNMKFGTLALFSLYFVIIYCLSYLLLCYIYNCYHKKVNLKALKKAIITEDGKIRIIYKLILIVPFSTCLISTFLFFLLEWRVEEQNYTYVDNSIARQEELYILFDKDNNDMWKKTEVLQKLHISEEFPTIEISQELIGMRLVLFDDIYKTGQKVAGDFKNYNQQTIDRLINIRNTEASKISNTLEEYKQEFDAWDTLYTYSNLTSDLYQSSRAAADIILVEEYSSLSNVDLLQMSSESIYRSENFLKYANRNINSTDEPIYIEVKDVAFLNGKIFFHLYIDSKVREEIRIYSKDFLVNAYCCMLQAEEEIKEGDIEYYARVNYYIGNLGQKMLNEIPDDNALYFQIGQTALEHYKIALSSLQDEIYEYKQEENMQKNIEEGIDALEILLDNKNEK